MKEKYFHGHAISEYGLKYGYVDYRCLASAFDAVLNNDIMNKTANIGYWEQITGFEDNSEEECFPEIFQWYIVSDNAVQILEEAGEIVFFNPDLDMYLWGVTHWGTGWDYVLTNIKITW